jgi:anti-anti-sigma factor
VAALQILVDRHDSVVTIGLLGELDMAEVDAFDEELYRIEQSRPRLIAIDLSELELIDSYGLSTLLDAEARAREAGRRLVLAPPPDHLMRVFRLTLLDRRFEWIDPTAAPGLEADLAASLGRVRARAAEWHTS